MASLTLPSIDFAALFERSPNAYMVLDRRLRCVAANRAYLQTAGANLDTILGRHLIDAFPHDPGDPNNRGTALVRDSIERVFETGQPHELDLVPYRTARTPGGPVVDRLWRATHVPLLDAEGRVSHVVQNAVEVTPEEGFTLERDPLIAGQHFLAESIPQQVWTALPDGRLDFVNHQVVEFFQASSETLLGAGWQEKIHPDDLPGCLAAWTRALATGEPYEVEFRLRRGDGDYRWYLGRALAQRDAGGAIVKWFGTNTDIETAKRMLDTLRVRTEYEQQLIGIVSHDLRNPLNVISLAAGSLNRQDLGAAAGKMIQRVVSAANRATRLVEDLLDFAQARSGGGIPILPASANLATIVRDAVDELRLGASDRTLRVVHHGEQTGRWDAGRLIQVIGNLVANALQHGSADAEIRVSSSIVGDRAYIEVANDGTPIPDSNLAQLFEPFSRGVSARVRTGRSVGLGLYIARTIVAAHQGSIDVFSNAEQGTCFRVTLPRWAKASAELQRSEER